MNIPILHHNKILSYILIISISCIVYSASAQSDVPSLQDNFYNNKDLFKQDEDSFKYYKISKRQKVAAVSLGVISLASIATGAYVIADHNPTGQSADVAIVVVVIGLAGIAAITGITALIFNRVAKSNKKKSIDFYSDKFGSGVILNNNNEYNYCIRANLGNNGMGLILSF